MNADAKMNGRSTTAAFRRVQYVCINRIVARNGHCWTDYRFARLFRNFVPLFDEVILWGVGAETVLQPFDLTAGFPNLQVKVLPAHAGRFRRALCQLPHLWRAISAGGLVCIDMPSEAGFLAGMLCKARRVPYLVQILGDWREATLCDGRPTLERRLKAFLADRMARATVRNARLALAQGAELFRKYAEENPEALQSDCVRSTLSLDVFHERASAGFHEPLRLLTASDLLPLKGLDILLQAIQILAAQNRPVEWWCAGEGPSREPLEDLANRLRVAGRVRFLGHVPHGSPLFELYRAADIFVMPSRTEGLPNGMLEAMANGLPIVASRVGGIPGALRDGLEGVLSEPGSPEHLARAIAKLAENPGRAWELGRRAFERAHRFTAEALAENNRRLIEKAFGGIRVQAGEYV